MLLVKIMLVIYVSAKSTWEFYINLWHGDMAVTMDDLAGTLRWLRWLRCRWDDRELISAAFWQLGESDSCGFPLSPGRLLWQTHDLEIEKRRVDLGLFSKATVVTS